MSDNCTTRSFNGCTCAPGECISYSASMDRKQELRDIRAAERTVKAKYASWRVFLAAVAVGSMCAFAAATVNTLTKMEREYQLEARI